MKQVTLFQNIAVAGVLLFSSHTSLAQEDLPYFLKDRGTGLQTSMIGTYVSRGQLLIFPFFEYSLDNNREY